MEHIFGNLTQVQIEIASIIISVGFSIGIDERIKQPELYIFYICPFEIIGIKLSHQSSPMPFRIGKRTVVVQIGIKIIGTTLVRIIGQIEYIQCRRRAIIVANIFLRIEFARCNLTDIMVGKLLQIALQMSRCERTTTPCEQRIYRIPCQLRTIETACQCSFVTAFRESRRHTRYNPRCRHGDINLVRCVFKIIKIRCIILRSTVSTRNKLGKFSCKTNL